MDFRTASLPGSVLALRCISHLRDPAVPGAGSARANGGAGGFPLPARDYRGLGAPGGLGCDCVLARAVSMVEAHTGNAGCDVGVRPRGAGARERVELMFHPVDHPAFAAAADVKLDKDDKLIVVKIGASARAYQILIMAYHHVVNDVVGGTAIAAT